MAFTDKKENGGVFISFKGTERVQWMATDIESGRVVIKIGGNFKTGIDEVMQYLSPTDAMALSKSLRALAITSLEEAS